MHLQHYHVVLIVFLAMMIAISCLVTIVLRFLFPSSKYTKAIKEDENRFDVGAWLRASMEETPGRASGKAISAFLLVLVYIVGFFYVLTYDKIWSKDFEQRQSDLIGTIMSAIVWMIIALYGVKAVAQSKWFSGSADTPDPKKNGNNNLPPQTPAQ
jgi:hypothetical protein